jgi:hypothetical protein
MIRETREVLAAMAAVNRKVPEVALGFMDDSISPVQESEFGDLLIELGELLHAHAHDRACQVIEWGDEEGNR